jgi:hypothetical protein
VSVAEFISGGKLLPMLSIARGAAPRSVAGVARAFPSSNNLSDKCSIYSHFQSSIFGKLLHERNYQFVLYRTKAIADQDGLGSVRPTTLENCKYKK